MPDMPGVPTFQFGHPVPVIVLMEADNLSQHETDAQIPVSPRRSYGALTYSARRASTGSTRVARRAGKYAANADRGFSQFLVHRELFYILYAMKDPENFYPILVRLVKDEVLCESRADAKCSGVYESWMADLAGPSHSRLLRKETESFINLREELKGHV
jgi:hypothetical protein